MAVNPPLVSVAQAESAAIVAGFSFFTSLSGFVINGALVGSINWHSILLGAGITAGVAFFTKLLAFSKI